MRIQLRNFLILCLPISLTGCGVLDRTRDSKHKQPEIICGPQITANYTVPQWGVLPATPAACCLPYCVDHSQFSLIESVPITKPNAGDGLRDQGLRFDSPVDGLQSDPTALTPGMLESPVVIPNPSRPPVAEPPLLSPTADSPESMPFAPSPSDVTEPRTLLPSGELPSGDLPNGAPERSQRQVPPAADAIMQDEGAPALPEVPRIQLPNVDQPQATSWGDADLPAVPYVADEDLFRYVF
ncbi:MAG: hypothetical protein Aurels2KO_38280 [Aureliella sp.]